jgi:hypothetical protein
VAFTAAIMDGKTVKTAHQAADRACQDHEVRLNNSESMVRICMCRITLRRLAKVA